MAVGSPYKFFQAGAGGRPDGLHHVPNPEGGATAKEFTRPKIRPYPLRAFSKQELKTENITSKDTVKHSIPVLRGRKKQSHHYRQQSTPNVRRNARPCPSPRRQREIEWLAEFDALKGLDRGQIAVRLDSIEQFATFLKWVRGRPLHAITLNSSLAGFERDFQTLHSLGLTDDTAEAPSADYLQTLQQEYAASPGIVDILHALPGLQTLDISRCDPSEPDLMKLLQGLREGRFKLTALQADHLFWGDFHVVASLLKTLSGSLHLEKLSINSCSGFRLTPHSLLKALRTNIGLKDVSLSASGKKGAVDPEDIALTIFMNSSLKSLSVSTKRFVPSEENRLADEGPADFEVNELVIYHFMSAFVKNTTLETLSIQGAALPAEIIDAITDSIGKNSAIRAINLDESEENRVALQGLQALLARRRQAGPMPVPGETGSV